MIRFLLTTFLVVFFFRSVAQAAPQEARLADKHLPFLKSYCFDCHDSGTQEGKVDLETLPLNITTFEQAELWQKILNALNAGEMPPNDSEQPGNSEKTDFLDALAQAMVDARKKLSDSGGKITMRRLNQREYRNTIQQLTWLSKSMSVHCPPMADQGTFDTVGSSQFISSDQIEQYLKLGTQRDRRRLSSVKRQSDSESKTFRVEPENTVNVESRKNMAQHGRDLPTLPALESRGR